jgi:hypothetical protein
VVIRNWCDHAVELGGRQRDFRLWAVPFGCGRVRVVRDWDFSGETPEHGWE